MPDLLNSDVYWWLFVAATFVGLGASVELGFRVGRRYMGATPEAVVSKVGTGVTVLFALLSFVLGISFSIAAQQFSERRQYLLEDANAIATAYLRAGFLPEPRSMEVRELLYEYARLRLDLQRRSKEGVEARVEQSSEIHERLWAHAEAVAEDHPRSVPVGLFVETLNEMIDLQEERVTYALRFRLPESLVRSLVAILPLSMVLLGVYLAIGRTETRVGAVTIVVAYAAIFVILVDLDQPKNRLFTVPERPMVDTVETIEHSMEEDRPTETDSPSR